MNHDQLYKLEEYTNEIENLSEFFLLMADYIDSSDNCIENYSNCINKMACDLRETWKCQKSLADECFKELIKEKQQDEEGASK